MEQKIGLKITDLEDDLVVAVNSGNLNLAVVKHNGRIHVLAGKCTHEGGALGEGHIDNDELVCPLHSGAFNLENGTADPNTPWVTDIKAYRARVDTATGEIFVEA